MNHRSVLEIRTKKIREADGPQSAIDFLENQLTRTDAKDERLEIFGLLYGAYIHAGISEQAIDLTERAVAEYPDDLNALIDLASHIYWFGGDLDRAMNVAERAVHESKKEHSLVRHALQTKARVAKKLGRFDLFEHIIAEILSDEYPTIRGDIAYEMDVIADLPDNTIDPLLLEKFREKAKRNSASA